MLTLISSPKQRAIFFATLTLLFSAAGLVADEKETLWPKSPVVVSPTEGVIESFWDSRLKSTDRWTVRPSDDANAARLVKMWDGTYLHFNAKSPGATVSITRPYAIDIGDHQRLILRTRPGEAVQTTVTATVDGKSHAVAQVAGSNRALEELVGDARCVPGMRKFGIKYSQLHPRHEQVCADFCQIKQPGSWRQVLEKWYAWTAQELTRRWRRRIQSAGM